MRGLAILLLLVVGRVAGAAPTASIGLVRGRLIGVTFGGGAGRPDAMQLQFMVVEAYGAGLVGPGSTVDASFECAIDPIALRSDDWSRVVAAALPDGVAPGAVCLADIVDDLDGGRIRRVVRSLEPCDDARLPAIYARHGARMLADDSGVIERCRTQIERARSGDGASMAAALIDLLDPALEPDGVEMLKAIERFWSRHQVGLASIMEWSRSLELADERLEHRRGYVDAAARREIDRRRAEIAELLARLPSMDRLWAQSRRGSEQSLPVEPHPGHVLMRGRIIGARLAQRGLGASELGRLQLQLETIEDFGGTAGDLPTIATLESSIDPDAITSDTWRALVEVRLPDGLRLGDECLVHIEWTDTSRTVRSIEPTDERRLGLFVNRHGDALLACHARRLRLMSNTADRIEGYHQSIATLVRVTLDPRRAGAERESGLRQLDDVTKLLVESTERTRRELCAVDARIVRVLPYADDASRDALIGLRGDVARLLGRLSAASSAPGASGP